MAKSARAIAGALVALRPRVACTSLGSAFDSRNTRPAIHPAQYVRPRSGRGAPMRAPLWNRFASAPGRVLYGHRPMTRHLRVSKTASAKRHSVSRHSPKQRHDKEDTRLCR